MVPVFLLQSRQENRPWVCEVSHGGPHSFMKPVMSLPPKPQAQPAMNHTQDKASHSIKQLNWNETNQTWTCSPDHPQSLTSGPKYMADRVALSQGWLDSLWELFEVEEQGVTSEAGPGHCNCHLVTSSGQDS